MLCSSRLLECTAFLALGAVVFVGATSVAAEEAVKSSTTSKSKETAGNYLAPWLVKQMVREINEGLKDRGIDQRFAAFQAYAGEQLDGTAGKANLRGDGQLPSGLV